MRQGYLVPSVFVNPNLSHALVSKWATSCSLESEPLG